MAPLRSALARRAIPQVRGNGALCLQHHKEADAGAFTPEQLRTLKEDPFLRRVDVALIGGFIWKREQLILRAGGGFYVRCSVLLEMASRPIIWLSTDADGNQLLNLDLWDENGSLVFSMRDNDWIVWKESDDVEAPPSARSLIVRMNEARLSVEFAHSSMDDVRAELARRDAESNARLIGRYQAEAGIPS